MSKPRAAVSWSGGKDSCLAFHRAREHFEVGALITMFTQDGTRSRSHGLRPEIIQRHAELLDLESISGRGSWQTYEAGFKHILQQFSRDAYTHVIFGDILLEEHKQWVERVCGEIGLRALEPLWGESTARLVREFLSLGGQAQIVATKASLLDESWLGKQLNPEVLSNLQQLGIDPCGEYGEFHTLVTDFPGFRGPLRAHETGRLLHDGYWMLDLALASRESQPPVFDHGP